MPTNPPMFLSRLLGRPVRSSDGVRVGRVVDMTVLYDIAHPNVHRLGVGHGHRIRYLLPWRLVQTYNDEVSLPVDRMGLSAYATAPDPNLEDRELLLAWDVLDTQVVDLVGRRLSRVSDVLLVPGPHGELEVAAVDVGAGSLLRRMGLRRLGDRFRLVAVDWLNCISRPVGVTLSSSRPRRSRCIGSTHRSSRSCCPGSVQTGPWTSSGVATQHTLPQPCTRAIRKPGAACFTS